MSIYRGRNLRDFSLASALYDSIMDNDFRGVLLLMEKGADPNIVLQKTGIAPFHLIIGNDSEEFALKSTKLILQCGGNPNIQSDEGLTPLHLASAWGRVEIAELLLNCGADPEKRDINYMLPLDYAIEYKHQECANILFKSMHSGFSIQRSQENEDYQLILEKVILNNGVAEAEYEVDSGKDSSLDFSSSEHNLLQLPQTTPIEYVRHWCSTHAIETQLSNSRNSEPEVKKVECKDSSKDSCIFNFSPEADRASLKTFDFVNCKPRNLNKNVIENFSLPYESSIKYKLRSSSCQNKKGIDIPISSSFCKHTEISQESGIVTLPDTSVDENSITDLSQLNIESRYNEFNKSNEECKIKQRSVKNPRDASSDYFTCNEISGSTNILEQNIFDVSAVSVEKNGLCITKCSSHGISIGNELTDVNGLPNIPVNINEDQCEEGSVKEVNSLNIAELYKYTDNEKAIVLYEKRLLLNSKGDVNESNVSPIQSVQSSKLSSLPASFDYDTDTLRKELIQCNYNPGPITRTTKRIYLRKLHHLRRRPSLTVAVTETQLNTKIYSTELETALKNPKWIDNLTEYKSFEDTICKEFNNPDPSRKWREGVNKSSFTYLLLDPRITSNLPGRAEQMTPVEVWQTFLSSIFYVGKGKRTRPYSHLYEAAALWKEKNYNSTNKKLQHIVSIWKENFGVVCLHVFQNVIPVEAYTREAAMINALKISNIKNIKSGDFYGVASTWPSHQQRMLGVLLLYKAMLIFLNEGERQLRPADIN